MSNPVILITGALTGIGRATALAFAKIGARLKAIRQPTLVVNGDNDVIIYTVNS